MPRPVPGQQYTIVTGDTLSQISQRAYGVAYKWREIWKSNNTVLRSGDPNLIYPGETIWVPNDTELESTAEDATVELYGKLKDEFTMVVKGVEIPVQSAEVTLTMDTPADGWTAVVAYDADDPLYDDYEEYFWPYAYPEAKVYLGGERVITGYIYTVSRQSTSSGKSVTVEGWSRTVDAIDSTVKSPYQSSKVTLKDRINEVIPAGIGLVFTASGDSQFDRVKAEDTETIGDHLVGLSKQRGIQISNTAYGEMLCEDVYSGAPLETLEEGTATGQEWNGRFDGRQRFNNYRALGSSPKSRKSANAKDDNVPLPRSLTFRSDETTTGNIKDAAIYKKNRAMSEALSIPVQAPGWYTTEGKLRKPNTTISLVSSTLALKDGFTMLVRQVVYRYNTQGIDCTMYPVPPSTYTKTELDDPWAKKV